MSNWLAAYQDCVRGPKNGFKITPNNCVKQSRRRRAWSSLTASNPTGAIYSEELKALTEVALEAGVYIMSDEIYSIYLRWCQACQPCILFQGGRRCCYYRGWF